MELAEEVVSWIPFVPTFKGNRDRPSEERLSLEIKRVSQLDIMTQRGWAREGRMEEWRDQILKPLWDRDATVWPQIMQLPQDMLVGLRQFIEYTRFFKGFVFGGEEVFEPGHIAIRLTTITNDLEGGLFAEINSTINAGFETMDEDELKNFVARCDGSTPAASIAPDAPEAAAPTNAADPAESIPA